LPPRPQIALSPSRDSLAGGGCCAGPRRGPVLLLAARLPDPARQHAGLRVAANGSKCGDHQSSEGSNIIFSFDQGVLGQVRESAGRGNCLEVLPKSRRREPSLLLELFILPHCPWPLKRLRRRECHDASPRPHQRELREGNSVKKLPQPEHCNPRPYPLLRARCRNRASCVVAGERGTRRETLWLELSEKTLTHTHRNGVRSPLKEAGTGQIVRPCSCRPPLSTPHHTHHPNRPRPSAPPF